MATELIVHPHQGVGPVRFGMTREQLRQSVAEAPRALQGVSTDHFAKTGMLVHYDSDGKVEAVGLTRSAHATYAGYALFAHPAHEVQEWARAQHQDLDDTQGFISTVLGISMSASWLDEPDLTEEERNDPAQSFLVFRPGYYEEGLRRSAAEFEAKGNARAAEIVRAQLARLRG